ncbi:MAG TPA: isochorismatase family cysteine hydrolase [Polyangiaceae bacterium]|jgi:nicotinamidase-related amidase
MTDEELADLLEAALARRTDRVAQAALRLMPAEVRAEVVALQEDLAKLALAEPAAAADPSVRARLLATVRSKQTRRALVIVDMINDHLTPGRILEVPRARDIVPALAARIARARAEATPIVYVLDSHDPNDPDLEDWGEHAVEGSEGAQVWPPLAPTPDDRIVTKPSYSSFFQSDLEKVLEDLHVDTIELTGCSTETQLLATATDALQRGFVVEVPHALQAGTTAEAEEAALKTLQFLVPYKPSRQARLAKLATA